MENSLSAPAVYNHFVSVQEIIPWFDSYQDSLVMLFSLWHNLCDEQNKLADILGVNKADIDWLHCPRRLVWMTQEQ